MPSARGDRGSSFALTSAQKMLWTAEALAGEAPVYSMAFAFVIDAPIEAARFRQAFAHLVDEADTLRTVVEQRDGEPRNRVLPTVNLDIPVIDFSRERDPRAAFLEWAEERTARILDVSSESFESVLATLGPATTGWYFSQHHLLTDAWGFSLLFRRLAEIYDDVEEGRRPTGPGLESFAEMARLVGDRSPDRGPTHGVGPVPLYGWRRGVPKGTASERVAVDLGATRTRALHGLLERPGWNALTRDLGVFRVLATAVLAYLHRVSGAEEISIGAPVHNRPTPRHRRSPGLFTEVYPLTVRVQPDDTFDSLHSRVLEETDRFLRSSWAGQGRAAENRNVNVVLNYLPMAFGDFAGAPVEARWLHSGHVEAEHQLRIHIADFDSSGGLKLLFDCNVDAIPQRVRPRVPDHFLSVLGTLIEDPSTRIGDVALADATERDLVLMESRGATRTVEGTVLDWFSHGASSDPHRVAVMEGERSWTYAELAAWTSRWAAALPRASRIGICLPRSAEAVAAMFAVLQAESAYVPIDPSWPASRIEFVVRDAGCALVIGSRPTGVECETEFVETRGLGEEGPSSTSDGVKDLAYVLYTSGSTGAPKGVEVGHASLANYVSWASDFYGRGLVFPLHSALTFDLTVTSVFVPLCTGGAIRVYRDTPGRLDLSVREVFQEDQVDIVKLTPSHLALLMDMDLTSARVRQLIVGGEDLTVGLARRGHARFGGRVRIHNEYGPTEATVGCVVHTYDPEIDVDGSVPIGRAIQNMCAVVLGPGGDVLPFGVPGRIWVSGASVARGYLGRPGLTAERFRDLPEVGSGTFYDTGDLGRRREDGTLEYLGRTDDQVKVRGVRVELGEVEAAIATHPDVISTVAAVHRRADRAELEARAHCLRCGLADNYPGVALDGDGICDQCREFEHYRERAGMYFQSMSDLEQILREARRASRAEYDCIALLSGGKDSTYALARIVDLGARPLAFTLDNGYISDDAKENIRRVTEALGVDHVYGSTPAMNEIFVDSLQRHANVCNGCFKAIYTLSMQLALEKGVPLIVTGLSRGQFFETRLTADLFREPGITPREIDDRVLEARKAYHRVDDAPRRLLDTRAFESEDIFEAVQFADFYRYCDVGLDEMLGYLRSRLPWIRPADTGRSTNCLINDVGIFVHKRERGFHNYALPYSWDVRLGHKTREEALDELDDDIDVGRVQKILEEIGYPEDVATVGSGGELVAYYTSLREIPAADLRSHVGARLPSTMVPRRFVRLEEMPTSAHGKVDRRALPDPITVRPETDTTYVAARTEAERVLSEIWAEVLGIAQVGVKDNFFDLGGDSITALRIVSRAKVRGLHVAPKALFEGQTVAAMAAASTALRGATAAGRERGPSQAGAEAGPADPVLPDYTREALGEDSLRKIGEILSRSSRTGK